MVTIAIQRPMPPHISASVYNKQYEFSERFFIIF